MAIIQTIRDKYAKLAGFIIILALLGFVLMDYGRQGMGSTTAAKINGEKIDVQDLFNKVNAQRNIVAIQSEQEITEEMGEQISEQVYENMVADILLEDIYQNLGITVSEEEITDMFTGNNPDYLAQRLYQRVNPQQAYDPTVAGQMLESLKDPSQPQQYQTWLSIKETLENTRKQSKVNALVAASFYTPKVILDAQNELNSKVAQIDFVQIPYTLVSDDKVTVTDEEINAYINENKYIFTNKINSKDLEIVTFPIIPSTQDSTRFFAEMDSLKSMMAQAENLEEFASLHSVSKVPANYFSENQLAPLSNSKDLIDAGVGTIVGPFPFETNYAIAKIEDRVVIPDTVEVKEIVVVAQMSANQVMRSKEEAKAKIDSAMAEINAGGNIDSVGAKYGDNAINNPNGISTTHYGDQYGMMPKALREYVFFGGVNTSKLVEIEENGMILYYYVQIQKKSTTTKKIQKIQFVTKDFTPSSETRTNIETLANSFSTNVAQGVKTYEQQALEMGLQRRPVNGYNSNSKNVPGIGVSVEFAKWAHAASVGSISPVMIINNNYVIAKLNSINVVGELNMSENAKNYAREEIKKKKKAEILKAEYDKLADINAISSAVSQPITSIDTFTLANPNNALLASESKVGGYVFSANALNQTSKGIKGLSGVYYVKVKNVNATPNPTRDVMMERRSTSNMYRQNAYRLLLNSKMEKADISDNRNKFLN